MYRSIITLTLFVALTANCIGADFQIVGDVKFLQTSVDFKSSTGSTMLNFNPAVGATFSLPVIVPTINTGLGNYEIGQNLRTSDAVVFSSVNAGTNLQGSTIHCDGGDLNAGNNDDTRGFLTLYGGASTDGAYARFYNAASEDGTEEYFQIEADDSLNVKNSGGSTIANFYSDRAAFPQNYSYSFSNGVPVYMDSDGSLGYDECLASVKENITDASTSDVLGLLDIRIRKYDRKDGSIMGEVGAVADEVAALEKQIPGFVIRNPDGSLKTLNWMRAAPAMLKILQDQEARIAALEAAQR